jgi:hypothetical protein
MRASDFSVGPFRCLSKPSLHQRLRRSASPPSPASAQAGAADRPAAGRHGSGLQDQLGHARPRGPRHPRHGRRMRRRRTAVGHVPGAVERPLFGTYPAGAHRIERRSPACCRRSRTSRASSSQSARRQRGQRRWWSCRPAPTPQRVRRRHPRLLDLQGCSAHDNVSILDGGYARRGRQARAASLEQGCRHRDPRAAAISPRASAGRSCWRHGEAEVAGGHRQRRTNLIDAPARWRSSSARRRPTP